MSEQFKTGTQQATDLNKKADFDFKKDLTQRVGRNPAYSKMAQYARGDDQDISDEYFYAFKDAYEQSPDFAKYHLMMPDDLNWRLSDRYWKLQDDDYEAHGLTPGSYESDLEYERMYGPEFENKYGTHDDFVRKSMDAWKRWMAENYGGHSEDHQTFGRYIRDNPEKFKELKQLQEYYNDWAGPGVGSYQELLDFWKNKLFGGQK